MGDLSKLLAEVAKVPEDDLASSWREPLKPGDKVGRYEIRGEIGRGGFGAVYEAFDTELGRTVALKALKPGRNRHQLSEEWIKKEAEAVAKLDHPAIVTIFDVGTCPAGAYLVMELLRGETLAKRIEKGPLPVDEALRVAEQMAEGLAHAHSRGVLHRDLKPANVFVCEDGRVKLLDFGLAHLLGTDGSSGAGTPAYMAPEQAAGAVVDERADVWAAGMVLGEMLTGKRPVERTPSPAPERRRRTPKTELMWEAPTAPACDGWGRRSSVEYRGRSRRCWGRRFPRIRRRDRRTEVPGSRSFAPLACGSIAPAASVAGWPRRNGVPPGRASPSPPSPPGGSGSGRSPAVARPSPSPTS